MQPQALGGAHGEDECNEAGGPEELVGGKLCERTSNAGKADHALKSAEPPMQQRRDKGGTGESEDGNAPGVDARAVTTFNDGLRD
jgi:hypothetical protein